MRPLVLARFVVTLGMLIAWTQPTFGCKCGPSFREKNAWENAKRAEQTNSVIFEGTLVRSDLNWSVWTAKEGELIPADSYFAPPDYSREPSMVLTFHVNRPYKGNMGSEVKIYTGLGGGDCAAGYESGLNYLIFANSTRQNLNQLWVSMCSPGGWVGGDWTTTDLRYLRKEKATARDLAPILRWSDKRWKKQEEVRRIKAEEEQKKYEAATGRICGSISRLDSKNKVGGTIAFLSILGYSPFSPRFTNVKEDGSFCSWNLGPGKYYLYFAHQDNDENVASYYPGVTDVAKATAIEVKAGETKSDARIDVQELQSYSVRGFIFADKRPDLIGNTSQAGVMVLLIRLDGDGRVWSSGTAKFFFPKTAYFKVDNVVPGRYIANVRVPGNGWMTRKTIIDVTSHTKYISLNLTHKN